MAERDHFTGPDGDADLYEELARCRRERQAAVLATVVEVTGSAPQTAGAKLLVRADGKVYGTIGGGAVERETLARATTLLARPEQPSHLWTVNLTTELGMCCGGVMRIFLERVLRPERLVLFGAGHIAGELAAAAARVGFAVTVVDERPEWATKQRFPTAREILCEAPEVALPELVLDDETYVVVVTHDHPLDQRLVRALCERPLRFLGLVASRTKRNKFVARLRAQGVAEEALERLRSPVGLELGAVTPAEIAISITAELIAVRRRGADASERSLPLRRARSAP